MANNGDNKLSSTKKSGYAVELMGKCNEGYDLKIDDKIRIDVKFSAGRDFKERIELQFNISKRRKLERDKGKTTDFYLFHSADLYLQTCYDNGWSKILVSFAKAEGKCYS